MSVHLVDGYIHAGDLVWAWDEETGDVALKEVVETYVNDFINVLQCKRTIVLLVGLFHRFRCNAANRLDP